MAAGGYRTSTNSAARKLTFKAVSLSSAQCTETRQFRLEEDGCDRVPDIRCGRRGMYIGCLYVSYEALDELVRISNEDK